MLEVEEMGVGRRNVSSPGHMWMSCRFSWGWFRSLDVSTESGIRVLLFSCSPIKVTYKVEIEEPRTPSQDARVQCGLCQQPAVGLPGSYRGTPIPRLWRRRSEMASEPQAL